MDRISSYNVYYHSLQLCPPLHVTLQSVPDFTSESKLPEDARLSGFKSWKPVLPVEASWCQSWTFQGLFSGMFMEMESDVLWSFTFSFSCSAS